ncbi:hypothetical protein NBRC10512_007872 [Rhodotorula toruloides]|uniref:RHTO0S04e04984g1_1 n=2 Tax=Rhodotorula toruloides TaxID=5286 RepID=A0A061AXJ0_RHOTO|nr:uncharacterized protein RHTO_01975 [Rhodotorula toruloides NP11]EMS21104.1 hypothetical protein RHTO_01975 [Rhodotorula toruloides NP11]CDR39422.1 RHTO0S04e04984g1_1 [Rhodotorula toruloides]
MSTIACFLTSRDTSSNGLKGTLGGTMFPDSFISRNALRLLILTLDSTVPLSALWLIAAYFCHPASPAIAFTTWLPVSDAAELVLRFRHPLALVTLWAGAEVAWWIVSCVARIGLDRNWWGERQEDEEIGSEERWRLWKSMLESTRDPWDWMGSAFLPATHKRAARGAADPALKKVKMETVGRTNVEEFIAHFMFNANLRDLKRDSLARAELHSMILLLEAQITLSRPGSQPFRFLRGRSRHRVFQLSNEPLSVGHHPLVFYAAIAFVSQLSNFILYLAGFRYYGAGAWTFTPFFMRSSRRLLESVLDPLEASRMGDARLAERVGYWMKPASKKAQEEDLKPLVFCHGISGTFVLTPFLVCMSYLTGRAIFLPEVPYVSMRLSPPSAILTRLEYVAAVRRMLWAHGFGLTSLDADENDSDFDEEHDEEEWRRGKAIVIAHSFGTGAAAWLLRDAPDIVAGSVLIDPMSFLLFASDLPRNFFRTKCSTTGEIFFRYFAVERGINHFLSRHLRWSDSVIFGPRPVAPLPDRVVRALVPKCAQEPLEPPLDIPNYAQWVSPCPQGPLPSVVFLSENDCILPIEKVRRYLEASGFSTGASSSTDASAVEKVLKIEGKKEEGVGGDTAEDGAADADKPDSEDESTLVSSSTSLIDPSTSSSSTVAPSKAADASLYIVPHAEHGAILTPWVIFAQEWPKKVRDAIDRVEQASARWETMDD